MKSWVSFIAKEIFFKIGIICYNSQIQLLSTTVRNISVLKNTSSGLCSPVVFLAGDLLVYGSSVGGVKAKDSLSSDRHQTLLLTAIPR